MFYLVSDSLAWGGPLDGLTLVRTSTDGLKLPGHVLRKVAEPVDFVKTKRDQRLLLTGYLFDAMFRGHGIGLAAPMTGVSLRIVVVSDGATHLAMFNPSIVAEAGEKEVDLEGNLCLPGLFGDVERPKSVTVKWLDVEGEEYEQNFAGWIARILCHEIEILDGHLFVDSVVGDRISTSSYEQRAAAATAHVFGKQEKLPARVHSPALSSCLTLPPPLFDLSASVLRMPGENVDFSSFKRNGFRRLVEAMFRQQRKSRGVGLAAPQVGLSLRLAVISNHGGEPLALINPELLESVGEAEPRSEGCLSIPGWTGSVPRSEKIVVKNHTVSGKPYELRAEGYLARIIQHEADHLAGVLYPDHAGSDALERGDHRALAEAALASAQEFPDGDSFSDSPSSLESGASAQI